MELPHDIEQRLERLWLARYQQDINVRQEKELLTEAEVTNTKAKPEQQLNTSAAQCSLTRDRAGRARVAVTGTIALSPPS